MPLNSNYMLAAMLAFAHVAMFNNSDSWGCSIVNVLKDISRCYYIGFARVSSYPVKSPLATKLSKCFVDCFFDVPHSLPATCMCCGGWLYTECNTAEQRCQLCTVTIAKQAVCSP